MELKNCKVLLSSGDVDIWADIGDCSVNYDTGYLHIVSADQGVLAVYAPAMWMRVETVVPEVELQPGEDPS